MTEHRDSADAASEDTRVDPSSTIELLERARHGDRAALDRLFARPFPPLRRWASGRLPHWARDVTDTDDIVQEALLQTFRRLDAFDSRGVGALYAYLRQAVLNRIRDELRRKSRRPNAVSLDQHEPAGGLSPLEQAIGSAAVERYERALAQLKPEDQEAIIARVELGCTYEEMAESLGKPSSEAARKAVRRAIVRLVEAMDGLPSA
jgi:RNA polymerase sigma-70 factor (ECF subfamily)